MKVTLYKMQGCGNDFLFLDGMTEQEPPSFKESLVVALCDRHYGIGADGLAIFYSAPGVDAAWRFYNCDGSEAEMCGNAARCAIRYLAERHFPEEGRVLRLQTRAGIVRGRAIDDGLVEITMPTKSDPRLSYEDRAVAVRPGDTADETVYDVSFVNTGVPHAVIEVKDIHHYPIATVGKQLVKHPAFGPEGSNVTFYQRVVGNEILSTTFERGVETETFACGTGATAAAIIFSERYLQPLPVQVRVPGGVLAVDLVAGTGVVLLRGPAEHVFRVEVELDAFLTGGEAPPRLYGERKRS